LTKLDRTSRDYRAEKQSNVIAAAVVAAGFFWRLWLARATFFNTDEAWHFSVANQDSLAAAYRASLSLAHPPLLIFILYFWKHFFSSDTMLRLPGVLAGTMFCWIFYKWLRLLFGRSAAWCGLIFSAFLPPLIVLSAELRQYSWMLLFAVSAAYFLERALTANSAPMMLVSSLFLWLAMLSHYSAFLFAASLGIYAVVRMMVQRPPNSVTAMWAVGQAIGVALAAFLVKTHISKLGSVYPGDPLRRFGDFYLADVYFHAGKESLPHFLYRGTFGVFRFICAQRAMGHLTTLLFVVGVILLLRRNSGSQADDPAHPPQSGLLALLLVLPFFINWIAVVAGFYPYGRTRQCVFLAIFGLAGISYCLAKISGNRIWLAAVFSAFIVATCHLFGAPHSLDLIVTAEQRHEHMNAAITFLRSQVSPADVLFTDKPTSFQLQHYLCGQNPVTVQSSGRDFDSFDCNGIHVISTALDDGSLTPQTFPEKLAAMKRNYNLDPATSVWVVQMAWSTGLGETLRSQSPDFAAIAPQIFDRYIEVFQLPPGPIATFER
jgi:hypothetical protein